MDSLIQFLIVEDNLFDVENIQRGFKRLKINNPVISAENGVEALEILRGEKDGINLKKPFVILLDLNMPKMNGFEFLEELRADEDLKDSTVYVLTTSEHKEDIANAYKYNIAGYLVKPIDREGLINSLSTLEAYWSICKFPT